MATDTRKTCLITGCSPGGIGHALALEFHRNNLRVLATARQASTLSDLASLGIETLSLEVHKPESIAALLSEVRSRTQGRGLDFLVNNAGRNYTMPALDVDFDEVREVFEVNVYSVMRMCQAFAPLLIEAKGCIVQIGSLAGVMPYVFGSAYNATKAALHAYSNTLRVELAPFGVKVVTIVTGGVQSRIARTERQLPEGSLYLPINEEYQRRLTHSQDGAMPNDAYARSVVRSVLGTSKPLYLWEGNKSWVVKFLHLFLPQYVKDIIFTRMFKLWKLSRLDNTKAKAA